MTKTILIAIEILKIVLLCVLAAVTYGILQDQVTARVCVEYFTIGHDPIFRTDSPTWLAIGWGILATWWVGVPLGIPAALLAQLGRWPRHNAADLVLPLCGLLVTMGCLSLIAGIVGYCAAESGEFQLDKLLASRVPEAKRSAFLADLAAHRMAYGTAYMGGIIICGLIVSRRWRWERKRVDNASVPLQTTK